MVNESTPGGEQATDAEGISSAEEKALQEKDKIFFEQVEKVLRHLIKHLVRWRVGQCMAEEGKEFHDLSKEDITNMQEGILAKIMQSRKKDKLVLDGNSILFDMDDALEIHDVSSEDVRYVAVQVSSAIERLLLRIACISLRERIAKKGKGSTTTYLNDAAHRSSIRELIREVVEMTFGLERIQNMWTDPEKEHLVEINSGIMRHDVENTYVGIEGLEGRQPNPTPKRKFPLRLRDEAGVNSSVTRSATPIYHTIITPSSSERLVRPEADRAAHQRLSEHIIRTLVQKARIRLGGFHFDGQPKPIEADRQLLESIESPFTDWLQRLQAAAQVGTDYVDKEKITDAMRCEMNFFHQHGGHTGRYSAEQHRFILERGLVAFIELEVSEDVYVAIGALSGLSRNPLSKKSQPLDALFPQFDMKDVRPNQRWEGALSTIAKEAFLSCRASMFSSMNDSFVVQQLQEKGVELPEYLENASLLRKGFPSLAKAILFKISQLFGNKYATSNIGILMSGNSPQGLVNAPSMSFNNWMIPLGMRKKWHLSIDELSQLRMELLAFFGELNRGFDALIGPEGIASGKGHDPQKIHQEGERWYSIVKKAINRGDHAPWGQLE